MDCQRSCFLLASLLVFVQTAGPAFGQYSGAFADGSRFEKATLNGWPEGGAPTLRINAENRDLGPVFAPQNPIAWLASERPPVAPAPQAFVEFFGGDRLPGTVVGYRSGAENPLSREAAHLVVEPDSDAAQAMAPRVRVRVAPVRKVVWKARGSDRYQPSTVFLLDGKQVVYRNLRWTADGVSLLLPEAGTVNYAFNQLAEVHARRQDPWAVYADALAHLTPDCSLLLYRVETDLGLVATAVLPRVQPWKAGQLLQPAWALDPVAFRAKELRGLRLFKPHEPPLSIVEPVRTSESVPLQGGRPWQVDRSVKQLDLQSGGKKFGHGFGVQAECDLEFPLPPWVRGFSTQVGLDRKAGASGAGKGRVLVNGAKDNPLWASKPLVGSGEVVASGFLPLQGPAFGQKTLTLAAEAADADGDAADPLHIRAFVDWLEPRFDLDPDKLRADVLKLQPQTVPAWAGWSVRDGDLARLRTADRWDIHERNRFRYRPQVVVESGSVALSRSVDVTDDRAYLLLGLSREMNSPAGRVEVRVDGQPAALWTVPDWQNWNGEAWLAPPPTVVPLLRYRGKTVKVEVEYFPAKDKEPVWWQSLELVASPDLVRWVPLEIVAKKAKAADTELVSEPAQTVFARTAQHKQVPREDTYTITAETSLKEITGFRLELLSDLRLPGGGPGRGDGWIYLTEFKVAVGPKDQPDQAVEVPLKAEATETHWEFPAANAVDGKSQTGWIPLPPGRTHVLVCTPAQKVTVPPGSVLTFTLQQNITREGGRAFHSPGRFRILATNSAQPLTPARPGVALEPPGRRTIFEDDFDFLQQLRDGGGKISYETKDKYSGEGAVKIVNGQRLQSEFLGAVRIRKEPALGEYRYLQWAWKKPDGPAIGLQLSRDRGWGRAQPMGPTFRYHAGPNKPWGDESVVVADKLPTEWTVVTRDLAADFGDFTLTGLSLDPFEGSFGLFDHIRLGRTLQDLEGE